MASVMVLILMTLLLVAIGAFAWRTGERAWPLLMFSTATLLVLAVSFKISDLGAGGIGSQSKLQEYLVYETLATVPLANGKQGVVLRGSDDSTLFIEFDKEPPKVWKWVNKKAATFTVAAPESKPTNGIGSPADAKDKLQR